MASVLAGLSRFAILLALVACVRRAWMPEAERFVVEGGGGGWGVVEMVVMAAGAGAAAGAKAAKAGAVGWREQVWCGGGDCGCGA